jgi:hypothetical protein
MNPAEFAPLIVAPSLPMWVLAPIAALSALIILGVMARSRDRAAAFVTGAAWLRYVMSAFHAITYRPLVAGMSSNALASIGVFLIGLLAIDWRHLALRFMTPFYVLIAICIVSAFANAGVTPGLINTLTKYGYLIVMTLSVYGAMQRAHHSAFMASLLWAFAPVLVFQFASFALGISKATETDVNAESFIGGYNHEAAFSVTLATCLVVACFSERLNQYIKTGMLVACLVGIFLANYRTTLVAIAPLMLLYFGASSLARFPLRDRPFIVSALIVCGAIVLGLASILFAERFADVSVAASGDVNFFKPPEYYSVEESRLLSGRPRIWMGYIFGWMDGSLVQHVIGFGPDSWNGIFPLYAHNTLINYLYEYGIVGVIGLLYLWLSMLMAALRVRHPHRGVLIGAHLSFLMLNMSTMPMWMIEGNILYGIICGYTLHLLTVTLQQQQAAKTQQTQQRRAPA